jgi:hypothetical protein
MPRDKTQYLVLARVTLDVLAGKLLNGWFWFALHFRRTTIMPLTSLASLVTTVASLTSFTISIYIKNSCI